MKKLTARCYCCFLPASFLSDSSSKKRRKCSCSIHCFNGRRNAATRRAIEDNQSNTNWFRLKNDAERMNATRSGSKVPAHLREKAKAQRTKLLIAVTADFRAVTRRKIRKTITKCVKMLTMPRLVLDRHVISKENTDSSNDFNLQNKRIAVVTALNEIEKPTYSSTSNAEQIEKTYDSHDGLDIKVKICPAFSVTSDPMPMR